MSATITLRVTPRSSQSCISRLSDGVLIVKVRSSPVNGAANGELMRIVARWLDVPPTSVTVTRGVASRTKRLVINGISQEEVDGKMARIPS